MLSAALQLRLPEDDRRVQGHHKLSSTRLYGRDDTHHATRRSGCSGNSSGSRPRVAPAEAHGQRGAAAHPGAALPGGATGSSRLPGPSRPPAQRRTSGEADSVSASEHPPQPPWTPARTRKGPDRNMSRSSYDVGGWSTRLGWAASRIRPASRRGWTSPWHFAVEPPVFSLAKRAAPKPKKKGGAFWYTRNLRPRDSQPALQDDAPCPISSLLTQGVRSHLRGSRYTSTPAPSLLVSFLPRVFRPCWKRTSRLHPWTSCHPANGPGAGPSDQPARGIQEHRGLRIRLPHLDPWLRKLSAEVFQQLGNLDAESIVFSQPAARLRMALRGAHMRREDTPLAKTEEPARGATPTPQQVSWMEHVPPKLTQDKIDALIDRFKKNYPAEILTQDTTPWCTKTSRVAWVGSPGTIASASSSTRRSMRQRLNCLGEARCSCSPTPSWTTRLRSTWTTNRSRRGGFTAAKRSSATPWLCVGRRTWRTSTSTTPG